MEQGGDYIIIVKHKSKLQSPIPIVLITPMSWPSLNLRDPIFLTGANTKIELEVVYGKPCIQK